MKGEFSRLPRYSQYRARGIQVYSPAQLAWIPACAGMTEGSALEYVSGALCRDQRSAIFEGGLSHIYGKPKNVMPRKLLAQRGWAKKHPAAVDRPEYSCALFRALFSCGRRQKHERAGIDFNRDRMRFDRQGLVRVGPAHIVDVNRRALPLDLEMAALAAA